MKIISEAPCRVDLAGGTLDIWPLYLYHPGAVTLNFAIDRWTRCAIETLDSPEIELRSKDLNAAQSFSSLPELDAAGRTRLPLPAYLLRFFRPQTGLRLRTDSEAPAGAGIAGSSALMIAVASALNRLTGAGHNLEKIRKIAQNVEAQIIRVPTGVQDYYPALYGGVSAIELEPGWHPPRRHSGGPRRFQPAHRAVLHRRAAQLRHQQLGSDQSLHRRQPESAAQLRPDRGHRRRHARRAGKSRLARSGPPDCAKNGRTAARTRRASARPPSIDLVKIAQPRRSHWRKSLWRGRRRMRLLSGGARARRSACRAPSPKPAPRCFRCRVAPRGLYGSKGARYIKMEVLRAALQDQRGVALDAAALEMASIESPGLDPATFARNSGSYRCRVGHAAARIRRRRDFVRVVNRISVRRTRIPRQRARLPRSAQQLPELCAGSAHRHPHRAIGGLHRSGAAPGPAGCRRRTSRTLHRRIRRRPLFDLYRSIPRRQAAHRPGLPADRPPDHTGRKLEPSALAPVGTRYILVRMLNNLRSAYFRNKQYAKMAR